MTIELSIVVPTYNERANIRTLIDALGHTLDGIEWEVIFVDDDSPDGTSDEIRGFARANARVRCVQRIARRGLSSASIEGMLASCAPYLAVIDADLQHDESLLPTMLATLKREDLDLVVASRYMAGASTGDLSDSRVKLSRFATRLSQWFLKTELSDPMSGFFLIRRQFLDQVVRKLYGRGFKILLDLFASAEDAVNFREVPYTMRQRYTGASKLNTMIVLDYLLLLLNKWLYRVVPERFLLFCAVGLSGVVVHMTVMSTLFWFYQGEFFSSQAIATWVSMTSNFLLNNQITYRDRKLRGRQIFRGLLSFYTICSVGAVINIALAQLLFDQTVVWWAASLGGVVVGAVWNFMLSSVFTWRSEP